MQLACLVAQRCVLYCLHSCLICAAYNPCSQQVAILDESMAVQEVGTDANVFESSWGFSRFIRLSALRRRGLLAGDCLRLRLTITVLPSLPAAVS